MLFRILFLTMFCIYDAFASLYLFCNLLAYSPNDWPKDPVYVIPVVSAFKPPVPMLIMLTDWLYILYISPFGACTNKALLLNGMLDVNCISVLNDRSIFDCIGCFIGMFCTLAPLMLRSLIAIFACASCMTSIGSLL